MGPSALCCIPNRWISGLGSYSTVSKQAMLAQKSLHSSLEIFFIGGLGNHAVVFGHYFWQFINKIVGDAALKLFISVPT